MSRFLSSRYEALEAYVPGEQPRDKEYIKLNTNESPFPPSKSVADAVKAEAALLNLYPDPDCRALRTKLAEIHGVAPENVFTAAGSDEALDFFFTAFCDESRPVAFPAISYGMYTVLANVHGVPVKSVPLREKFRLAPEDFTGLGMNKIVCNPNAPTGRFIPVSDIEKIAASDPEYITAVDEAYIDFGGESSVSLLPKHDNLMIFRTFSKSRSLAGGRLGYVMAGREIIEDLEKIKYSLNPYNINRLTAAAALATLDDDEYYRRNCEEIIENREYTTAELAKLGFETLPSKTNFIFTRSGKISGSALYGRLKDKGVLIRHWNNPAISEWCRVTIGSREEMETFLRKTKEIIEEAE